MKKKTEIQADDTAALSGVDTKLALAKKIVSRMREELSHLERMLGSETDAVETESLIAKVRLGNDEMYGPTAEGGRTIEGVFDGQHMVGSDGHQYIVPPNYASKSKLVEGDILKLTIQPNGTFLYKQIGPIERQRVVGTLVRDEVTNDWEVVAIGKKYLVLAAAVSYHKADEGDDAVILIPNSAPSKWAALENVIKKGE